MVYAWWNWQREERFDEITVEFEIHNDIELSGKNGIYFMTCFGDVNGIQYYYGLQTDLHQPELGGQDKGLIFSRWETRDLSNAKVPLEGWTQSSGHEGDFIGVRRSYDWSRGSYQTRMAPDGDDDGGRWYGLWITDLEANEETWIGSLKFPFTNSDALLGPTCYNTVEIYGSPTRPVDVPNWKVTLDPPRGDGKPGHVTRDGFSPFTGGYRNAILKYNEEGQLVYEVGLDYIPSKR